VAIFCNIGNIAQELPVFKVISFLWNGMRYGIRLALSREVITIQKSCAEISAFPPTIPCRLFHYTPAAN
jgi:hypothetical protein